MSVVFFFLSLFLWTSFLSFFCCCVSKSGGDTKSTLSIVIHHHSFLSLKHQNALLSLSLFRRRRRRRCLDWENSTKRSGTPRRCAFLFLFLFFFFRESDFVAFLQNAIGGRRVLLFLFERITNFRHHHQNSPSSHRIFDDTISNRYPAETMTRNRRFQK